MRWCRSLESHEASGPVDLGRPAETVAAGRRVLAALVYGLKSMFTSTMNTPSALPSQCGSESLLPVAR